MIDEARRRARRIDETPLDDRHESWSAGGDAEIEAIAQLGGDWVLAQLDVLTPEQRDVVVLRVVSDLTIEAIADVLGKPVGAVKAMQRRAFSGVGEAFRTAGRTPMSNFDVIDGDMADRRLTDADIEALIDGRPVAGAPAQRRRPELCGSPLDGREAVLAVVHETIDATPRQNRARRLACDDRLFLRRHRITTHGIGVVGDGLNNRCDHGAAGRDH